MTKPSKLAVVAGATGVVGRCLAEQLAGDPEFDVVALARKPVDIFGTRFVAADLTNAESCRAALAGLTDATHIFYTARFDHVAGKLEPVDVNLGMLSNLLDAVEPIAPRLAHLHVVHGTKWYGSNLGAFPTPAHEDDPRGVPTNFYYAQQDFMEERQRGKSWSWSTSRPHGIMHAVPDTPRSIVLVVGVYALICKELGLPLYFPGTQGNYDAIYQCTSDDQLAHAVRWMADTPACANQAFNVLNGDYIRWSRLWPFFADYFGMKPGPVRTVKLADTMADKADVWERVVRRHGLKGPSWDRLVLWGYGDFVFTPDWDIMSDSTKIRQAGFHRTVRTQDEFVRYFERFKALGILP